ncbi:hypoxanthine phosphoribosyltransferase [Vulgatibacter incomptus]|uniref:Hypoxanthine phosphoribosyltransferase n=1 Tax=Vulgatibacter incomptus TaxID=1391653 RepID=A0A0K1PEJ4_9BACT|nr:hypoxanthine phosphoribosyltransferase [Vulgatibacter incomptus]AKU91922.1 Hypoxanthine-guanine phosphoribosyltransferase [Vulgatibacter incomptus]
MNLPGVKVLHDEAAIAARVGELGTRITRDYQGKELVVVGVLKGSFMFFADLVRAIDLPISIDFLGVASYGGNTKSSGVVQLTSDLSHPITGKHVLLVEDIVDTGLTMRYLLDNLATRHPASLAVCSLLEKPARMRVPIEIVYLGFSIPDEFVVGYGLDHAQKYRNLGFLGILEGAV